MAFWSSGYGLPADCETVTSNACVLCVLPSPSPQWPPRGKDGQSLVRHITLAEGLAHLRLWIKLVWLKCWCPTSHPPLCFLLLQLLAPEGDGPAALEFLLFIAQNTAANWHWLQFSFIYWLVDCSSSRADFSALRWLFSATDWVIPGQRCQAGVLGQDPVHHPCWRCQQVQFKTCPIYCGMDVLILYQWEWLFMLGMHGTVAWKDWRLSWEWH